MIPNLLLDKTIITSLEGNFMPIINNVPSLVIIVMTSFRYVGRREWTWAEPREGPESI